MDTGIYILALILGYLLGSISFGRLLMRLLKPGESLEDVEIPVPGREEGYKLTSMGGNTVSMKLGARGGCAVGILDILKAFIPTLAFKWLLPEQPFFLAAALGAFVGHAWPLYHRFKGGRGISPFYGGLVAFDPVGAAVVALISLVLGIAVFKELLVAYAGGVLLLLPWLLLKHLNHPWLPHYLVYAVLINILFILALIPEMRQITAMWKKYGRRDVQMNMETFPMGQQMLKLMRRLGLSGKASGKSNEQAD